MATDPRKLRPTDVCRLLNSTPLGEVVTTRKLHRHRERAGMRVGDGRHVDLLRYVAWLVQVRHAPKQEPASDISTSIDLDEAAQAAAELACGQQPFGHGQKFTRKHEILIAALLTERTHAKAAAKAGISKATLNRWMHLPEFQAAYRRARHSLFEASVARMQAVSGLLVDAAINVALKGRKDSDRTRASFGLLDRAHRGLPSADFPRGKPEDANGLPQGTAGLVKRLESLLEQLDRTDLPIAEKTRLATVLSDSLLRAYGGDEMAKRMEALETVLQSRKEKDQGEPSRCA